MTQRAGARLTATPAAIFHTLYPGDVALRGSTTGQAPSREAGQVHPCHRNFRRSLQIIHALGCGEGLVAARGVAAGIEPLGARHGRIERRPRLLLGPPDRGRRRLLIELRADRLRRHRSSARSVGRPAHRLLEPRDLAAARAGLRRGGAEAEAEGGNNKDCGHFHDATLVRSVLSCATFDTSYLKTVSSGLSHLLRPGRGTVGQASRAVAAAGRLSAGVSHRLATPDTWSGSRSDWVEWQSAAGSADRCCRCAGGFASIPS